MVVASCHLTAATWLTGVFCCRLDHHFIFTESQVGFLLALEGGLTSVAIEGFLVHVLSGLGRQEVVIGLP